MKKFIITIAICLVLVFSGWVIGEYVGTGIFLQSSSTGKPLIKIENTNLDGWGPTIEFHKTATGSAIDNDRLGWVDFYGLDDANNSTLYGYIDCRSEDVSDGDEAGKMIFNITMDSVSRNLLELDGKEGSVNKGEVLINGAGLDVDFRVESDTEANAFFVEGDTGYVGVGDGTPSYKLDVNGNIRAVNLIVAYPETITCAADACVEDIGIQKHFIVSDGGADANADALTLDDGTIDGQESTFVFQTETDVGDTIVIDTVQQVGWASFTMAEVGDSVTFLWDGTNWTIKDVYQAGTY